MCSAANLHVIVIMYRPTDMLTLAKQQVARGATTFARIFYVTRKLTIPIQFDIIARSRDAVRGVKEQ